MNKNYRLLSDVFFYIAAFFMIVVLIVSVFMVMTGLVDNEFDWTIFMLFIGSTLLAKATWFGGEYYMRKA